MKKVFVGILLVTVLLSFATVYAEIVNEIISAGVIRFHIIAASESEEDNRIKLDVRDYVSEHIKDTELVAYSREYVKECERLANVRLEETGTGYKAKATFEKVYIPKKSYKNITLPSGKYNAIRLVLGNGEGENWWCVAYPPLCFTEEVGGILSQDGEKKLKNELPEDIYGMISGDCEYRFFIVDLIGNISNKLSE
ncbi:MAG: stage II sporulation protein R [Eubacteriales bacterium]|nr:stage II sporulation protein R [Eubacteriales bacterium]